MEQSASASATRIEPMFGEVAKRIHLQYFDQLLFLQHKFITFKKKSFYPMHAKIRKINSKNA